VPALELDDGTVLTEGAAIVQYIADQVPAKQLAPPNGQFERARLQSWLNFIASEIQMGCFCPLFHSTTSEAAKTMYRAASHHAWVTSTAISPNMNTCWGAFLVERFWIMPLLALPAAGCAPHGAVRAARALAKQGEINVRKQYALQPNTATQP
jgi:hypothetical protein